MGISMGGSSSNSSNSSSSTSESWLADKLGPMIDAAINGQGDVPLFEQAGMTQAQIDALNGIIGGRDWTGLQGGANAMGQAGWQGMTGANDFLNSAMGNYNDVMGSLTGGGYQEMVEGAYNSDLVNKQLEVMGKGVQDTLNKNVQGINQRASGSGNMGSSRAGVAEGVAIGDAADAMAAGTAQIQGNAWGQALDSANKQAGNLIQGSLGGLSQGNNILGSQADIFNTGMGWGNTIGQGQQQDLFNKFQAGSIFQQDAQGKLDLDRINSMISSNQALAKLGMLLPVLGGTAGWQTSGTQQGSGSTSGSSWGANVGKSDARLKDDIKLIKEGVIITDSEGAQHILPNVYEWTWNEKAMAVFEDEAYAEIPPAYGVIAQELETIPALAHFVHTFETSVEGLEGTYKAIDYEGLRIHCEAALVVSETVLEGLKEEA